MDHQTPSSGRVGPEFSLTAPAGLAIIGLLGAVYGAAAAFNPWAIFNPVVFGALCFAIGYTSLQVARLGRLRNGLVATVFATLCAAAFMLCSALALRHFSAYTGTLLSFLGERRAQGVTLFGSVSIGGVWLIIAWVLQAVLAWLVGCAAWFETTRPFCESCRSWAWKRRWRFRLPSPDPDGLDTIKQRGDFEALMSLRKGGDPSTILVCDLGACNCGYKATLTLNLRKRKGDQENAGDRILTDLPVLPSMAERLFEWAERLDPSMQGKRPNISFGPPATDPDTPLDIPYPEGEPESVMRWDSTLGATDCEGDNTYMREVRRRIRQDGYGVIPAALASARNHEDLAFIAESCADWIHRPDWLDLWREAEPDSPDMLLILGIHSVKSAWEARGGGFDPKDFELFQHRLREALPLLTAATDSRPDDPTPYAWLIWVTLGLQDEEDELEAAASTEEYEARLEEIRSQKRKQATALLNKAHKLSPFHRPSFCAALKVLEPQWHGDPDRYLAFARKASEGAPAGKSVHVVIPEAHVELAYKRSREENDKRAISAYLSQPEVQRELHAANERAFRQGHFTPTMGTPRVRAYFAYALWKAGLRDDAAEHLRIIGRKTPYGPFTPNILFSKDSVRTARRQCRVRGWLGDLRECEHYLYSPPPPTEARFLNRQVVPLRHRILICSRHGQQTIPQATGRARQTPEARAGLLRPAC